MQILEHSHNMTTLYKPIDSLTLAETTVDPQIRLGIQSPPGLGKTWAALTFPNPVVLNYNRGLGAHIGRSDVIEVPFYDRKFVDKIHPPDGQQTPPNKKDALLVWLHKEGSKLTSEQTLVLDSSTEIETAYHTQYKLNPVITKKGKEDDFAEWRLKIEYFGQVTDLLKSLKCHVVYITHETVERDKEGELTGGARPLLTGQSGDSLAGSFTDWFRQRAIKKPTKEEEALYTTKWGWNREWNDSTPKEHGSIYLWQTSSDSFFKCKSSSLLNPPMFVLANYNTFLKYRRKIEQPTKV
jgi:hypothetical protein